MPRTSLIAACAALALIAGQAAAETTAASPATIKAESAASTAPKPEAPAETAPIAVEASTPKPPEAAEAAADSAGAEAGKTAAVAAAATPSVEAAALAQAEAAPSLTPPKAAAIKIPSLKPPHEIEATGFEKAADVAQILSRLGRESDPARFVAADVEAEIYRQTPGAQLLALDCVETPATEMSLFLEGDPEAEDLERGLVNGLQTSFPLILTLRDEAGQIWRLRAALAYEAVDLRDPQKRKVTANFTILGHQKL